MFLDNYDPFMSRTSITWKLKMSWFPNEGRY